MNKIILLGPPGAGKGTQADLICSFLNIPKISTGDMLREAIASETQLGKKVAGVLNSGSLVSDEIIGSIIVERIQKQDCKNGFLFDGVPRTIGQATMLEDMNVFFSHVIEIQVDDEIIINRMSGRRFHIAGFGDEGDNSKELTKQQRRMSAIRALNAKKQASRNKSKQ